MNNKVIIRNCNNISEALISLRPNCVNIKYAYNGTGKSTISKAIKAKADNDTSALNKLKSFGTNTQPFVGDLAFQKVIVFNEEYVSKYVFQNNASFDDSYNVLIRSDEIEKLSTEISHLLSDLQNLRIAEKSIYEINQFLGRYSIAVPSLNNGISKRGGVGEVIRGSGSGFDKYPELQAYRPYYSRKLSEVSTWAKWRTDGIELMDAKSTCPFCAGGMDLPVIKQQNETIRTVFKASALKSAQAILAYLRDGVSSGYINASATTPIENYLGDTGKRAEIESELSRLAAETKYLSTKILNVLSFAPMNVTTDQLEHIEDTLREMEIDINELPHFYSTDTVRKLAKSINSRINILLGGTSQLRGLFNRHEEKIKRMINDRENDVNDFLAKAGFPYRFSIQKQGEKKATTKLVPVERSETDIKVGEHLSWGEKNSFSLVMFIFEAVSENADLVVLDDPISSFDVNKKFAIMKRMFDSKKPSFRGKTLLFLTHDLEPIIDFIHTNRFGEYGINAKAMFLTNEDGIIREQPIERDDLQNIVTLTQTIAMDATKPLPVRIVNMRKYEELVDPCYQQSSMYNILSNLIHGRPDPLDADEMRMEDNAVLEGIECLKQFGLNYTQYGAILNDLSLDYLLSIARSSDSYSSIIAIRLIFERERGKGIMENLKKQHPAAAKFLNETNHIENDYVYQLNPCRFFEIPTCYLSQITSFLSKICIEEK